MFHFESKIKNWTELQHPEKTDVFAKGTKP
jgi:hypothetical protein